MVQLDFESTIKIQAKQDVEYQKSVKQVKEGTVRRYWLENDTPFAKGNWIYAPKGGELRWKFLHKTYDAR